MVMGAAIISPAITPDTEISMTPTQAFYENLVVQLETDLDSCEDAWQADLAECEFEKQEAIMNLGYKLVKCEGYLEQCPD
jgi:hypothetical protein